jgi:hypothetical protein
VSPTVIGSFGLSRSAIGSVYVPTPIGCGAGAPQLGQNFAPSGIAVCQLGQFMRASVRRCAGRAYRLGRGSAVLVPRPASDPTPPPIEANA